MKNAFYLSFKALFVLKIFKFLSSLFEYEEKTAWLTNNYNVYLSRSKGNQTIKFDQVIECKKGNIFLQNHAENEAARQVPDLFVF